MPERSEGRGFLVGGLFLFVFRGLGVDEVRGDGLDAEFLDLGEAGDGAGGVVVVRGAKITRTCSIDAFVESCKDLGGLESRHIEEAAPDFGGGEAAGCQVRNNAKVVRAAFEGAPEIRVG